MKNITFLDIETVPRYEDITEAPNDYVQRWEKFYTARNRDETFDLLNSYPDTALHAEFNKIVTIGLGHKRDGVIKAGAKTMEDEVELLSWFTNYLDNRPNDLLCAHGGKIFDFPILVRRLLINNMLIPIQLQIMNIKPWEAMLIDTMDIWSCNQYYRVTLDLLCWSLGIESPKDAIDGTNVSELYFKKDFGTLNSYCKGDVVALIKCYERLLEMKKGYIAGQ